MKFITWNENYLTNIKEMDDHHKKLVDILNQLYEGVFECGNIDDERLLTHETLLELQGYAQYHFAAEETLLVKHDYPAYQQHQEEHVKFNAQVNELVKKLAAGEAALSFPTFIFLKDWLTEHILKNDKGYSLFLREQGEK